MPVLFRPIVALLTLLVPAAAGPVLEGRPYDISAVEIGPRGEWVLYPTGVKRTPSHRSWLTQRLLIEVAPGRPLPALTGIAGISGVKINGRFQLLSVDGGPAAALRKAGLLALLPGVLKAEPLLARQLITRVIPDDPYFAWQAGEPGYQWHLCNSGQNGGIAGIDLNITEAWNRWTGRGVTLGIVDDGLETTHADLVAHVDIMNGYDFNEKDADPSPGSSNHHGTACAGAAAATGNNSQGVSGAAPDAMLAGLRLVSAPTTDEDEAAAFLHASGEIAIKSNSWGPDDDGSTVRGPRPLSRQALTQAVNTGRGGKGTVFVWAGGNGAANGDDSNYDGWANAPGAIAVSAISDHGTQSPYSEPGANLLVCAPSNGGSQGITTTDRTGSTGYNAGGGGNYSNADYTRNFGGTSTACPLVAGVAALMLEANPALGYRDVQEILVRTARRNDPGNRAWITNGAGVHFNVNYGAGLVDAAAATAMAETWTNLPSLETRFFLHTAPATPIPDSPSPGLSYAFQVSGSDNLRLEHVTVQVRATHPLRGELEWSLTSPGGITARLARARPNDREQDLDWTFMTTHFRGERSVGEWTLQVTDRQADTTGTLESAGLTLLGTPATGPLPLPVITSSTNVTGREGTSFNYRLTASNQVSLYEATGLPPGVVIDAATGRITGEPEGSGLFIGTLSATNATGTTTDAANFQVLAADPALAEAVDQPASTKLVPFGDGTWFSQAVVTHDGIDAVQSGGIGGNQICGMEMTVAGPATLSFRWKVSSEANYDFLILAVDGNIRRFTSGEQDWAPVTVDVGEGKHIVDFDYLKDNIISGGADAGWVDQLTIAPVTAAPVIVSTEATGYISTGFNYQIAADGVPSSYGAAGLPGGLVLAPATGRIKGTPAASGVFPVSVSATNQFGTGTAELTLTILSLSEGLAAATDATGFPFTSDPPRPWMWQTVYSRDRSDAARSGSIGNLAQSGMSVFIEGPATGSFYWGISSEPNYDYLHFSINGAGQAAISGETGWILHTFTLAAGLHELKWSYVKDDFVKSGLDAGFVDQLSLVQDLDNDGFALTLESYFGTSDRDPDQQPITVFANTSGAIGLSFPSVAGNSYRLEGSDDLGIWVVLATITATGSTTTLTDAGAGELSRRFYRIMVP